MSEYDRVPADPDAIQAAREVKEQQGESWSDVFTFYAALRSEAVPLREAGEQGVADFALDSVDGTPMEQPDVNIDVEQAVNDIVTGLQNQIDAQAFNGGISEEHAQRMEQSLATVEQRTGRIESMLEEVRR